MKLAIPTEDGLTIRQQFSPLRGFLISTIELGEIVGQEMREMVTGEIKASEERWYHHLEDCEKVMVREIDQEHLNVLKNHRKEVITTGETIITTALIKFLNSSLQNETNKCCCP
jgi:hypothetical protein